MAETARVQRLEIDSQLKPHESIRAATELFDRAAIEAEAHQLITNRDVLPRVDVYSQERYDNARTALMEALTASGHLSTIEISGTLQEINAQILSRLLNGWDDSLPEHEQQRRFAELCNELVIQRVHGAIQAGKLPIDTEVTEISDYPEALAGLRLGYRDSNKKGMVRTTGLLYQGGGIYTRKIEQVSRSNGTWVSTFGFFSNCNIDTGYDAPDIAALSTPIIHGRRDYVDGVVDIMRQLDKYAGKDALYGDTGNRTLRHPHYNDLRAESLRREQEIECYFGDLANLETQLESLSKTGSITKQERTQIFQEEVQRILDAICTLEPAYAEDTFGAAAAAVFYEASILVAQGRNDEATQLLMTNEFLKETVTFCGMSISVDKAKELGLSVNSYGDLVETGKKNWRWKKGVCQVKACPSPKPTEVGPCSVCRRCQNEFDHGRDPTKRRASLTKAAKPAGEVAILQLLGRTKGAADKSKPVILAQAA